MNLSRKLPLAIAMALLFTLAAGFFGLWSAHRSLGVFHGDVQRHMAAERLAAEVEGHFKTQVQEWKNVLLRGSDNALREQDRKSTRLNSSHSQISYAVFCLKKKKNKEKDKHNNQH